MKPPITTHVLDTSRGMPAAGIGVRLAIRRDHDWFELAERTTDADGRISDLLPPGKVEEAVYRLSFDTGTWFDGRGIETFYPSVEVTFEVHDEDAHYHVPLLLNPYGYSTYRGS